MKTLKTVRPIRKGISAVEIIKKGVPKNVWISCVGK